jgi:hypothetical protein
MPTIRAVRRGVEPLADQVPNPDPTLRTIEVVDKAIESLFEKLEPRFSAINERFELMDKASKVLHEDYVRVPTVVDRSITNLRELFESNLKGRHSLLEEKINSIHASLQAMDKAIILLQTSSDKLPDFVIGQVDQLKEVHDEKIEGAVQVVNERIKSLADVTTQQFASINDKFAEKDKAVSVGLSAQKESAAATQDSNTAATNKMEANFTALLTQGRELLAEVRKGTEQQVNDLKTGLQTLASRLDRGEGRTSVSDPALNDNIRSLSSTVTDLSKSRDTGTGQSGGIGIAVAAVLGLFAVISTVASVAAVVISFSRAPAVTERITVAPPMPLTLPK